MKRKNQQTTAITRLSKLLVALALLFPLGGCMRDTPKPTYTVTFDVDGGSAIEPQKVKSGAIVTKLTAPIKQGFAFEGWYTAPAKTKAFNFDTPITANTTLYAKWREVYLVSFNTGGGSPVVSQNVAKSGAKATKPTDPTLAGNLFLGWYSDKAKTQHFDFNTIITANTMLYAKWEVMIYLLFFNTNGGSAVIDQRVASGTKATRPTDPTKDKVLFDNWYTDDVLTKAFDFSTPITASTTLYAKWKTTVVGTITGLTAGATVQLLLKIDVKDAETITLQNDQAAFAFSKEVKKGQRYFVSVQTQPTTDGLKCWVEHGSGTMGAENVNLTVFCSNNTKYQLVPKSDGSYYGRTECVKDVSVTPNLIWEGKTIDGGLRDMNKTYTNYDDATKSQKIGGKPTQAEINAASNTIGYVNAVNETKLGGFSDWRLPTKNELVALVSINYTPKIDPTWFPNTNGFHNTKTAQDKAYWTSSLSEQGTSWNGIFVAFDLGFAVEYQRESPGYTRLVRTAN